MAFSIFKIHSWKILLGRRTPADGCLIFYPPLGAAPMVLLLWQLLHNDCRLLSSSSAPPSRTGTIWSTTSADTNLPATRHARHNGSACKWLARNRFQAAESYSLFRCPVACRLSLYFLWVCFLWASQNPSRPRTNSRHPVFLHGLGADTGI